MVKTVLVKKKKKKNATSIMVMMLKVMVMVISTKYYKLKTIHTTQRNMRIAKIII